LKKNFNSSIWGCVESGDENRQKNGNHRSFRNYKFNFSVSGKYVDAFRTLAGTGTIPAKNKVPSNFIIDYQPDITSQNTSA
jgi:Fe(3+) dicitrate transport protein